MRKFSILNFKFLIKYQLLNCLGLLVLLICIGSIFVSKAQAQELSLGIFPPIIQIEATAPTSIKTKIAISNDSDTPVYLSIQVRPFKESDDNNGHVQFMDEKDGFPGNDPLIYQKMEILDNTGQSINEITLSPKQEKQLILHIALPQGEPSGDYYFTILFISKDQLTDQNNTSHVIGGIGTNVLLSVGPKAPANGVLADFSAPFFLTHGPVPFSVLIGNTSDHFIVPTGNIVVTNMYKQTIGNIKLLPVNVLAKSQRYIPDNSGNSDTEAIWKEKVLFGIYSAKLTILLSQEGPLFERTIYFVVIPIQGFVYIAIALSVIIFIIIRLRKRLRR